MEMLTDHELSPFYDNIQSKLGVTPLHIQIGLYYNITLLHWQTEITL